MLRFQEIEPQQARALLESAMKATRGVRRTAGPVRCPISDSYSAYHALRAGPHQALPPGRKSPAAHTEAPAATTAGRCWSPSSWPPTRPRTCPTAKAASRCADHIVDYGCDQDFGRPLRMSPAKAETFLLDWLPRKVLLSPAEQHAMPHVLAAWVRWTGRQGRAGPRRSAGAGRGLRLDGHVHPGLPRPGLVRPGAARWWPGCCPTPTWRRCPAGCSRSACCRAATAARTWPRSTRPARGPAGPAGGRPRRAGRRPGERAHRPAPGAGRPALARRPAGALGRRAAPARPRRGPARGAAHADRRSPAAGGDEKRIATALYEHPTCRDEARRGDRPPRPRHRPQRRPRRGLRRLAARRRRGPARRRHQRQRRLRVPRGRPADHAPRRARRAVAAAWRSAPRSPTATWPASAAGRWTCRRTS